MASPYAFAFTKGISLALDIWDRTRDDPLDTINSQLGILLENSQVLLEGVQTLHNTAVDIVMAERQADIQLALSNLLDSQTSDNSQIRENATNQALNLSGSALANLTTLINSTQSNQIERAAIVPLLVAALSTRLTVIRDLRDGALATGLGTEIENGVAAIYAAQDSMLQEFRESVGVYVDSAYWSGYLVDNSNPAFPIYEYAWFTTIHFFSDADPSRVSDSFEVLIDRENGQRDSILGRSGPGPRNMADYLEWAETNNVDISPWYDPILNFDLEQAGFPVMQELLDELLFLTGGEWHLGTTANDVLSSDRSSFYVNPDTLDGRAGDDDMTAGNGDDVLRGGDGNDVMAGRGGDDLLLGGNDNDRLNGGTGDDTLNGGDGSDRAVWSATNDVTVNLNMTGEQNTGQGRDVLISIEHVSSGSGNDLLTGNRAANSLSASDGNDTLYGGDGADTLNGGFGHDVIIGGNSQSDVRDVVFGGRGNDSIDGGYGNDELRGDAGNDIIAGGFGADTVIGGTGDDTLTGSAFGDQIFGGDGNDFINGGWGYDLVNGGAGADRFFHIGIADHGSDWIQDYNTAEGDVLQFGIASATRSQFQINTTHTATAAGERSGDDNVEEAFVIYRPTGQIMWALVDGGGQSSINLQIGQDVFDLMG
ncbi:hypothetical protein CSC82_12750 [Rhodobacteraceae bacterium 4F10]|nr:hypothetical protein CSC82_12750 [Rhodobacteraceae bacterium 4F10]